MQVTPKSGPTIPASPNSSIQAAADKRSAAINAFMGNKPVAQVTQNTTGNSQQEAVRNPSQVSPEELSAISPTANSRISNNQTQDTTDESESVEAPAKAESPLSERHALLARREKQIRQREQALRTKESAIRASEEAAKSAPVKPSFDEKEYVKRDRLTQDPFTVLNELGLTYDQLTEMALNAPKAEDMAMRNELRALRDELKAVKGETESNKKSFEEQQTNARKQAVNEIKSQVTRLVSEDPAFETIKATRSVGDVVELIERTFDEDGILMSVEEAAQEVEEYLATEALRLAKLNKIQQRLKPQQVAQLKQNSQVSKQQGMKTLTNSVTSSRPLSARERAILAFQNKLQK
jgi:hypothetical protein